MSGDDKPRNSEDAAREAKLAQALRANLRRRKAPARAAEKAAPSSGAGPDDKRS